MRIGPNQKDLSTTQRAFPRIMFGDPPRDRTENRQGRHLYAWVAVAESSGQITLNPLLQRGTEGDFILVRLNESFKFRSSALSRLGVLAELEPDSMRALAINVDFSVPSLALGYGLLAGKPVPSNGAIPPSAAATTIILPNRLSDPTGPSI